jgi:ABC-type multidrug transport system ATPase subunit
MINGHVAAIEDYQRVIGFVPQDDIVFADLTVMENFIYNGLLRLPKGTKLEEIQELAEETVTSLGLRRVAHNLVGDHRKRSLSGGEKKRVNIGLELMAKPSICFLGMYAD